MLNAEQREMVEVRFRQCGLTGVGEAHGTIRELDSKSLREHSVTFESQLKSRVDAAIHDRKRHARDEEISRIANAAIANAPMPEGGDVHLGRRHKQNLMMDAADAERKEPITLPSWEGEEAPAAAQPNTEQLRRDLEFSEKQKGEYREQVVTLRAALRLAGVDPDAETSPEEAKEAVTAE
jgi:hypothetical protein